MDKGRLEAQGYRPLDLADKPAISALLLAEQPETSELTFSNLFIWRAAYRPLWREAHGCLLIIHSPDGGESFGLPPAGGGDHAAALAELCQDLKRAGTNPQIRRAGEGWAERHVDQGCYTIEPDRAQSDYVYLAHELIDLPGRRFHAKKNQLNQFLKRYEYKYRSLDPALAREMLAMQEAWCEFRRCAQHPDLASEDQAVYQAISHHDSLGFSGGAILIEGKLEAFALGEPLNADTAVIHAEKANPDIPGLYAAINQMFCTHAWAGMKYINREQDLGVPGLRKAKQSYNPHHMVEKFIVWPR